MGNESLKVLENSLNFLFLKGYEPCHTPLLEKFLVTWASFSRHQTNFGPAQQFDRTLGPHETVQYFLSVHTGL